MKKHSLEMERMRYLDPKRKKRRREYLRLKMRQYRENPEFKKKESLYRKRPIVKERLKIYARLWYREHNIKNH